MIDVRTAMRRSAFHHADRPAIVADGHTLTYREAWERAIRLANAMLSVDGVRPGDRVAVLENNHLGSSDFFAGTAAANLVRVPLYARNSRDGHLHMLRQTQSRVLVVDPEFAHDVEGFPDELPELERVIVRDAEYEGWLSSFSSEDPNPEASVTDFYLIRHSAGTTGKPKGIAFTHEAWMNMQRDWTHLLPPIELGDHCTHVGPISHGAGYLFLPVWMAGGVNILEPEFDARRTLDLLSQHGGFTFGVPTMVADMVLAAQGPAQRKAFTDLKAIIISGAPIGKGTTLAARELFGDRLYQVFGQTECAPIAFMGPREWFGDNSGTDPLSSVGRVMPYAELDIRTEDGTSAAPGEPGEIVARADGRMVCFWNDDELTRRRMVDGWVRTGDVGYIDEHGFLYLVGRKDDMMISGGYNIWPAELENVISEIPGVSEVVVIPIPHERWGESPMAIVVADDPERVTEVRVREECIRALGSYKKPTVVQIRDERLPRTPVGKISRSAIRAPYWEGRSHQLGEA